MINYQVSGTFILYCREGVGGSVTMYRDRVRIILDYDYFSEAAHLQRETMTHWPSRRYYNTLCVTVL